MPATEQLPVPEVAPPLPDGMQAELAAVAASEAANVSTVEQVLANELRGEEASQPPERQSFFRRIGNRVFSIAATEIFGGAVDVAGMAILPGASMIPLREFAGTVGDVGANKFFTGLTGGAEKAHSERTSWPKRIGHVAVLAGASMAAQKFGYDIAGHGIEQFVAPLGLKVAATTTLNSQLKRMF